MCLTALRIISFCEVPNRNVKLRFWKRIGQIIAMRTLYVMPFTETYSSLLWSSSWILLGAVIGVAMLLRPGGTDGVDRAIAAIFLLQVIVILSFMGLAQRYVAELFPFLIFIFLIFLRQGKIAFQLRYLLIGLVVVSVVINSLTTVSWLVEADMNVPAETRTKWNQFLGRTSRG